MFRAYGLATHIWSNNVKSALLLAGFPVLLLLLTYALFLLFAGFTGVGGTDAEAAFVWAAAGLYDAWPFALGGAGAWFAVSFFAHQAIIDASLGARRITREEDPRLWNLLENLCISRGIPMPALRIMETEALNAFASGLTDRSASVTVTRGLLSTLDDAELEAVLAHELTHIKNKDIRLLVISIIFVGVFSFVGEMLFRTMVHGRIHGGGRGSGSSRSEGGGGAQIIVIVVAFAIIAISYALAIVIRFALSRRREYLADAGAVELTKSPDAMISALRKISGRADVPRAPAEMREMFFENAHAAVGDVFATHPPIEKRIAALVVYAGGLDMPVRPTGPWG
jgi:heat shock protein HtpX